MGRSAGTFASASAFAFGFGFGETAAIAAGFGATGALAAGFGETTCGACPSVETMVARHRSAAAQTTLLTALIEPPPRQRVRDRPPERDLPAAAPSARATAWRRLHALPHRGRDRPDPQAAGRQRVLPGRLAA